MGEGSASCRNPHLIMHKNQTAVSPVGFEPAIPASEQPQTYALKRAATGIGYNVIETVKIRTKGLTMSVWNIITQTFFFFWPVPKPPLGNILSQLHQSAIPTT